MNPVPPQRVHAVITTCFSTSKFSLMFSLSKRISPVPLQSGHFCWFSLLASKTPVFSSVAMCALVSPDCEGPTLSPNPKKKKPGQGPGFARGEALLRRLLFVEELGVLGRTL